MSLQGVVRSRSIRRSLPFLPAEDAERDAAAADRATLPVDPNQTSVERARTRIKFCGRVPVSFPSHRKDLPRWAAGSRECAPLPERFDCLQV